MSTILSAASTSLTLLKEEPLIATLHFLRDFLGYGGDNAPSSSFDGDGQYRNRTNPQQIQEAVKKLTLAEGEQLVQRCMTGMMYTFPQDCFPDASGVLLGLFQLLPREVASWTAKTVSMLPQGSIAPQEQERLLRNIQQRVENGEVRKIRSLLQDFTNSYRRRNVAPREGLGRLEATKFKFAG
jgi:transportin-3